MPRRTTTLLALTALATAGAAVTLWLRVGTSAAPPIFLLSLIALTCLLRLISQRR